MSAAPSDGVDEHRVRVGLIAVGGALGALTRAALAGVVTTPQGTLLANVAGSLLLGVLVAHSVPRRLGAFAATGFCSSFTTYSTFAVETLALSPAAAVGYVAGTYGLGVVAAAVGARLGGRP